MPFWNAILTPALTGQHRQARQAIALLPLHTPSHQRERLEATCARALLVMNSIPEALARLARGRESREGQALATLITPQGRHLAAERMAATSPGAAADAACDATWLALRAGCRPAAADALAEGLRRCPDHAEARRWSALLARLPDDAPPLWVLHPPAAPRPLQSELAALCPSQAQGWLSWERLLRRPWGHEPPPASGGLARLRAAGVISLRLLDGDALTMRPPEDPVVEMELLLDRAFSQPPASVEGAQQVAHLWREAAQLPPPILRRVAAAVVTLALRNPQAAPVGVAAAEVLSVGGCAQWRAAQARLLASCGSPAAAPMALSALQRGGLAADSWALAIEALARTGQRTLAQDFAELALGDPGLSAQAFAFLEDWGLEERGP